MVQCGGLPGRTVRSTLCQTLPANRPRVTQDVTSVNWLAVILFLPYAMFKKRTSAEYNNNNNNNNNIHSFIHSAISIAPLQVLYYSEALPTTARILHRSFTPKRTGNCR